MDPNTALLNIATMVEDDLDGATDNAVALRDWMARGGYRPVGNPAAWRLYRDLLDSIRED